MLIFFLSLNTEELQDYDKNFTEEFNVVKYYYNKFTIPEDIIKLNFNLNASNSYNVSSMYYNNFKAFSLIEQYQESNNFIYDVIVKFRADISTGDTFTINENIEHNTLYIPEGNNHGGINDQIAYGNFDTMKLYSNLYNDLDDIRKNTNTYHPETLLYYHTQNKKLNLFRFNYRYDLNGYRRSKDKN